MQLAEFHTSRGELLDPLQEALLLLERERQHGADAALPRWEPEVWLDENDETLVVRAALPGTSIEDVRVRVADDLLTLEADRRSGDGKPERGFMRSFLLPLPVRPEAVDAVLRDGVLTVTVDKKQPLRPRRIPLA